MADDKDARENQAQHEERRQRERDIAAELERGDEAEPPFEEDLDELESLPFPVTGAQIVEEVGDQEIEAAEGTYTLAELLPNTDVERFESAGEVRSRVRKPAIATAMKRIGEASSRLPDKDRFGSQREAYVKTFQELKDLDPDDDDEGIQTIADWIVEEIRENENLPGSRGVRRQAAKVCRAKGYDIRNDDWLGV